MITPVKRMCENTWVNSIRLEAFKGTFADVRQEAIDVANHQGCDVIFIFQDKAYYISLEDIQNSVEEITHETEENKRRKEKEAGSKVRSASSFSSQM